MPTKTKKPKVELHELDAAAFRKAAQAVGRLALTIPVVSERLSGTDVSLLVHARLNDLIGEVMRAALKQPPQRP